MEVGGDMKVHAPGDTRRRHWIQLPSFPFNLIACKCHARKISSNYRDYVDGLRP